MGKQWALPVERRSQAGGLEAAAKWRGTKKEEFAGVMVHMVPENSFPQICVVSEDIIGKVPK